jgi:hypothetical protein
MPISVEIASPNDCYLVTIEDDGKVAYAYLHDRSEEECIIGDVWLYNSGETPDAPEWKDPNNLPFSNPRGYALDNDLGPILRPGDVKVVWETLGAECIAHVVIHQTPWAILKPNSKPGWCRLAAKSGPLATPLVDYKKEK